jgi:L-amino acid N-acyltransferase YncA
MRVTFAVETWAAVEYAIQGLWQRHYAEVGQDKTTMFLAPDIGWYRAVEAQGSLSVVIARSAGLIVGYQISVVRPHTHYCSILCSFEDAFYLAPEYRKGITGIKLISESLKFLKQRGVKRAYFMSSEQKPTSKIFKYLGFVQSHTCWSKWLGAEVEPERIV